MGSLWERWRPPAWSQDWVLILFPWKLSFWWSPHNYLRTRLFTRTHYTVYLISIWGVFFLPKSTIGNKFCRYQNSSMFRWNHSFSEHSQAKLRLWLSPHGKTYKYIWKYTKNIFDKICFKIYLCKYIFILIYFFDFFVYFWKYIKKYKYIKKNWKYIYFCAIYFNPRNYIKIFQKLCLLSITCINI